MQPYLCIGVVAKPQGVKGEVKVVPYTDDIRRFDWLTRVYLKTSEGYVPHDVLSSRHNGEFAFLRLDGVPDRNAAEHLRDAELFVSRDDAAKLPEGRYFIADLIGCRVVTDKGETLGRVVEVLQGAGGDVYVVKGQREILFPALKALLLSVDIEGELICVDADRLREVAVYED